MIGRYWTNWLASMVELTTRWRKCTKTFDVRSSPPWDTASTWWVRARGRQAAQWNVNAAVAAASVPRKGTAATVQTATQDGARLTFSGDSAWPQTPPRQTHVRFRFNLIVKRFWRNYDKTDTTEAISRMSHCESCTNGKICSQYVDMLHLAWEIRVMGLLGSLVKIFRYLYKKGSRLFLTRLTQN